MSLERAITQANDGYLFVKYGTVHFDSYYEELESLFLANSGLNFQGIAAEQNHKQADSDRRRRQDAKLLATFEDARRKQKRLTGKRLVREAAPKDPDRQEAARKEAARKEAARKDAACQGWPFVKKQLVRRPLVRRPLVKKQLDKRPLVGRPLALGQANQHRTKNLHRSLTAPFGLYVNLSG